MLGAGPDALPDSSQFAPRQVLHELSQAAAAGRTACIAPAGARSGKP